jgi:hypothetical protein
MLSPTFFHVDGVAQISNDSLDGYSVLRSKALRYSIESVATPSDKNKIIAKFGEPICISHPNAARCAGNNGRSSR